MTGDQWSDSELLASLSWEQLYALPTDPAKLQSVLQAKFTRGFGADANPTQALGR